MLGAIGTNILYVHLARSQGIRVHSSGSTEGIHECNIIMAYRGLAKCHDELFTYHSSFFYKA